MQVSDASGVRDAAYPDGYIEFADDSTVSGSDGCNDFSGTYTADGATLVLDTSRMTEVGCDPAPEFRPGAQYSWELLNEGDFLRLTDAAGVEFTFLIDLPLTEGFPEATDDVTHGGTTWAVVLAGADALDAVALFEAENSARAAGYLTGPTSCDEGAAEALGAGQYTVSVYFDSEAVARQALAAFQEAGFAGGAVAEVVTYCLD
jgi:hypothetical protein